MAQVPEQTLSWLYSRLHDYHDPQRAYTDIARSLSAYTSLLPRTDAYTYESGAPALLLNLDGTIPANFRGTTYRFPIKLWVPQAYPQEPPMVYVQPSKDMLIRPGQHVGVDGRIYHPYLRDWASAWDRVNIVSFLEVLQQVFAKETPVISRAQQQQLQRPIGQSPQPTGGAPGPPRLPPKPQANAAPGNVTHPAAPPPRPPKPGEEHAVPARNDSQRGPPLPPLPSQARQSSTGTPQSHQGSYSSPPYATGASSMGPAMTLPIRSHQTGSAGISPATRPPSQTPYDPHRFQSPVSSSRVGPGYTESPGQHYSPYAPQSQSQLQQQDYRHAQNSPYSSQQIPGGPTSNYAPRSDQPRAYPPPVASLASQIQPAVRPSQPQVDLLSSPLETVNPLQLSLSQPAPVAAPPIPPNPEKEHLQHALRQTLNQQIQAKVSTNLSAIGPLSAQNAALRTAAANLALEIQQLEQFSAMLSSNEEILRRSMQECDVVIAKSQGSDAKRSSLIQQQQQSSKNGSSHSRTNSRSAVVTTGHSSSDAVLPNIDDLLITPNLVASQLWRLCAEEAAVREAMYVLQRGLGRGRVSGPEFIRLMRGLARECFFKMALARKCARGMGLDVVEGPSVR